jgi:hypothetical protein
MTIYLLLKRVWRVPYHICIIIFVLWKDVQRVTTTWKLSLLTIDGRISIELLTGFEFSTLYRFLKQVFIYHIFEVAVSQVTWHLTLLHNLGMDAPESYRSNNFHLFLNIHALREKHVGKRIHKIVVKLLFVRDNHSL